MLRPEGASEGRGLRLLERSLYFSREHERLAVEQPSRCGFTDLLANRGCFVIEQGSCEASGLSLARVPPVLGPGLEVLSVDRPEQRIEDYGHGSTAVPVRILLEPPDGFLSHLQREAMEAVSVAPAVVEDPQRWVGHPVADGPLLFAHVIEDEFVRPGGHD